MICYRCGTDIGEALGLCSNCQAKPQIQLSNEPQNADDSALDFLCSQKFRVSITAVLGLILVIVVWYSYGISVLPTRRHPPGILVPEAPFQGSIQNKAPWTYKSYRIIPLASFRVRGVVLLRSYFYFGGGSDLAPVDLTLAWGPVSDQQIRDQIRFSHFGRLYSWSTSSPIALPSKTINDHCANMHMVPANTEIHDKLKSAREGDIVTIEGFLIRAERANGWSWQSSLTREDSGPGACELIWVENMKIS